MENFQDYSNIKKRSKNDIEYHWPIDNFCSNSKIFKKLILKQI